MTRPVMDLRMRLAVCQGRVFRRSAAPSAVGRSADDLDVLGAVTTVILDAATPAELDSLVRFERTVAAADYVREVNKEHLTVISGDSSVALLGPEPSDRAEATHVQQIWSPNVQLISHG